MNTFSLPALLGRKKKLIMSNVGKQRERWVENMGREDSQQPFQEDAGPSSVLGHHCRYRSPIFGSQTVEVSE